MWKCGSTKGGADQVAACVDHAGGFGLDPRFHGHDPVPPDADIGHTAIGQRAAPDDQIEGQRSPLL